MKDQPVITAATIVGVIMAGLVMAVSLGWINLGDGQMKTIEAFLVAAVPLLLSIGAAVWANRKVTTYNKPATKDGEPAVIVPAAQFQQMAAAADIANRAMSQ